MTNNVCRPRHIDHSGQFNKVFENLFNKPVREFIQEQKNHLSPVYANIEELSDMFIIHLAIPGYDKTKIGISQKKNKLTITGKKDADSVQNFKIKEFDFSSFERSFYLPEDVQNDKIEASVENGILKVVILKAEQKPPVKVTIK